MSKLRPNLVVLAISKYITFQPTRKMATWFKNAREYCK